jgi:hypothetical protein
MMWYDRSFVFQRDTLLIIGIALASTHAGSAVAAIDVSSSVNTAGSDKRFSYTIKATGTDKLKDFHVLVGHQNTANPSENKGDCTPGNYNDIVNSSAMNTAGWSTPAFAVRFNDPPNNTNKDCFISWWGTTELGGIHAVRFDHVGTAASGEGGAPTYVTSDGDNTPKADGSDLVSGGGTNQYGPYQFVSVGPAVGSAGLALLVLGAGAVVWRAGRSRPTR